jgi:hypothetical protein
MRIATKTSDGGKTALLYGRTIMGWLPVASHEEFLKFLRQINHETTARLASHLVRWK